MRVGRGREGGEAKARGREGEGRENGREGEWKKGRRGGEERNGRQEEGGKARRRKGGGGDRHLLPLVFAAESPCEMASDPLVAERKVI